MAKVASSHSMPKDAMGTATSLAKRLASALFPANHLALVALN